MPKKRKLKKYKIRWRALACQYNLNQIAKRDLTTKWKRSGCLCQHQSRELFILIKVDLLVSLFRKEEGGGRSVNPAAVFFIIYALDFITCQLTTIKESNESVDSRKNNQ